MTEVAHDTQAQPHIEGLGRPALRTIEDRESFYEPFDVDEIARLIVNSFRFSQGFDGDDVPAHQQILQYIASQYRNKIDPNLIQDAVKPATETALKIITKRSLHPPVEEASANAYNQIDSYANLLKKFVKDKNCKSNMPGLTRVLIKADHVNLFGYVGKPQEGRQREPVPEDEMVAAKDPFLSHFVFYGLMKRTTGVLEYDQMFADVVKEYEANINKDDDYHQQVQELVRIYIGHHPETIELLPEKYR